MAEVTYVAVTWTSGDTITEAKLDNMVANDRAVDAMTNGIELTERADPSTPASNKIHMYAKDKSRVPSIYVINDAGTISELSEQRPTFLLPVMGTLVVGASVTPIIPANRALTIVKAYAVLKTGPVGDDLILDINKNGTSIWASTQANRLTVTDGNTSASQTSFDTTSLVDEDSITLDVDQLGSSTGGSDLSVYLRCK